MSLRLGQAPKALAFLASLVCALAAVSTAAARPAPTAVAAPVRTAAKMSADAALQLQVLGQMNSLRARHRLARLQLSPSLHAAAVTHSREMGTSGFFSHSSADGSGFDKRVARYYGMGTHRYWSVGENLLWASGSLDAAGALQLWLNSPEHRENLLNGRWREVGLSAVRIPLAPGFFEGLDVTVITVDFGVRR